MMQVKIFHYGDVLRRSPSGIGLGQWGSHVWLPDWIAGLREFLPLANGLGNKKKKKYTQPRNVSFVHTRGIFFLNHYGILH